MTINWQQIREGIGKFTISTKALVGSIVTGTTVMQMQEARDFVIKKTVGHPHVASIALGAIAILVVLHNPKVQKILHIAPGTPVEIPAGTPVTVAKDTDATTK